MFTDKLSRKGIICVVHDFAGRNPCCLSITVKLYNLNKKDDILRNYKNFDRAQDKKRKVRVYQSLSPYYKEIKDLINEYCSTRHMAIAWAHWRSASCGLAIKLKDSNRVITKVHCLDDFTAQLSVSS